MRIWVLKKWRFRERSDGGFMKKEKKKGVGGRVMGGDRKSVV